MGSWLSLRVLASSCSVTDLLHCSASPHPHCFPRWLSSFGVLPLCPAESLTCCWMSRATLHVLRTDGLLEVCLVVGDFVFVLVWSLGLLESVNWDSCQVWNLLRLGPLRCCPSCSTLAASRTLSYGNALSCYLVQHSEAEVGWSR